MNEAWYAGEARNFDKTGLLHPVPYEGAEDHKFRPIFPWLVFLFFKILGVSEISARLTTIFFNVLSLIFVYLIIKNNSLNNKQFEIDTRSITAALYAVSLLAVSPIYTVVGRNVQPDAVYVCLILIALYLYIVSENNKHHSYRIILKVVSGIFIALGSLTKNPAIMILPVIVIWELLKSIDNYKLRSSSDKSNTQQKSWVKQIFTKLIVILLPFVLVLLPLVFYKLSVIDKILIRYKDSVLSLPSKKILSYMWQETLWAFTPPVFISFLFIVIYIFWEIFDILRNNKRFSDTPNLLLFIAFLFFALFYFVQNVHSYYMLGTVPFVIILVAEYLAKIKVVSLRTGIFMFMFATSLLYSLLMLCSLKYGNNRFIQIKNFLRNEKIQSPSHTLLLFSQEIYGNYKPVIMYYIADKPYTIASPELLEFVPTTNELKISKWYKDIYLFDFLHNGFFEEKLSNNKKTTYIHYISEKQYGLNIMGHIFFIQPFNRHSFIPAKFVHINSGKTFLNIGMSSMRKYANIQIIKFPKGYKIFRGKYNYFLRWGGGI